VSKSGFEFVYFEGPAVLTAMDQKQAVFIFLLFLCALIFQIGGANLKIYDDKGTHSTCTIIIGSVSLFLGRHSLMAGLRILFHFFDVLSSCHLPVYFFRHLLKRT